MHVNGQAGGQARAIVGHLDTLGAQVVELKSNGRLRLQAIGTWSARFAEGARVTIFGDDCQHRGQILPLKAAGHAFDEAIDTFPIGWDYIEVRVDTPANSAEDLHAAGLNVGDIVAIDTGYDVQNGFITARHLDNKAGSAAMLAALEALCLAGVQPLLDTSWLFTISEEVGSGASAVLHGDIAELLAVDNGVVAPGQNSSEHGVTVAMGDMSGPFDYHLTHHLLRLVNQHHVPHQRDVFRYYRCDAASAIEAGADIRTGLICFGVDGSHGWERTHVSALRHLAHLIIAYALSGPAVRRDRAELATIEGFPQQPMGKYETPGGDVIPDEETPRTDGV
jgi:peptidase M42 family hydrolase